MNLGHNFSESELAVIETMKHRQVSRGELLESGIKSIEAFFLLCENNGILVYENDDNRNKSMYGVLV